MSTEPSAILEETREAGSLPGAQGGCMLGAEAVLLEQMRGWWQQLNQARFGGELIAPVLELSRRATELGRWQAGTRTLSLSWSLVSDEAWGTVVAVLEHEMAHQYVDEVLRVHDEPPHGPAFRRVCASRGIDPSAAGLPEANDVAEDRIVRRIRKLLALAESPEEAEAKSAAAAAFRLMLKHNVSGVEAGVRLRYAVRHVGGVSQRRPKHEQLLAGLLAARFFVDVTLVPALALSSGGRGRAIEVIGSRENVELAAWVWEFLLGTGERLWERHARATGARGRAARHRFLEGVVIGFRDRLDGEASAAEREEGLVWVGDPGLEDFVAARHPHRRRGRRLSLRADGTMLAGREAGKGIVLRRPMQEHGGPSGLSLPGPRRGEGG